MHRSFVFLFKVLKRQRKVDRFKQSKKEVGLIGVRRSIVFVFHLIVMKRQRKVDIGLNKSNNMIYSGQM